MRKQTAKDGAKDDDAGDTIQRECDKAESFGETCRVQGKREKHQAGVRKDRPQHYKVDDTGESEKVQTTKRNTMKKLFKYATAIIVAALLIFGCIISKVICLVVALLAILFYTFIMIVFVIPSIDFNDESKN